MKTNSLTTFAAIALLTLAAAATARAQSAPRAQAADIPFEFTAGDQTFPAGVYRVERVNTQTDRAALSIKSGDGRLSVLVQTMPVETRPGAPSESAMLVFNRYGDRYFLSQIWQPSDEAGLELPKSRAERALRRGPRASRPAPARETVALASARPR